MEWSEFAERFSRELAGLDRDTILIVRERDESRHYVQAMREPDRLYAEAVSNNFLDGPLLLTPADEEVLSEAGWRPPTADWSPANWWTELPPPAAAADFARLSDMMVTALRDVQGVRRPADLVYESFHRHGSGLIELVDFGIDPADRSRITERRAAVNGAATGRAAAAAALSAPPAGTPSNGSGPLRLRFPDPAAPAEAAEADGDIEERLGDAKQRGDQMTYFEILLEADLVLPVTDPAPAGPNGTGGTGGADLDPARFVTTTLGGTTFVAVFTSPQAMSRSMGRGAPEHRRTTFARLAAAWPDPQWSLAINPGLPSEIHLDAATVRKVDGMRRTAEQVSTVDALVTPSLPEPPPDSSRGPRTRSVQHGHAAQATQTISGPQPLLGPPPISGPQPLLGPPPISGPQPVPARSGGAFQASAVPAPLARQDAAPGETTAARETTAAGAVIRPPHGARLWWQGEGGSETPVAVYDATGARWEPVSVGRRARRRR